LLHFVGFTTENIPRYLQDYGLLRCEATVDMNASEEPGASIFAIGAQKTESALSLKC